MDWNRIAILLEVIHKAAAAGPVYGWLVSQADAELSKLKELHTGPAVAPPIPFVPTDFDLIVKPIGESSHD